MNKLLDMEFPVIKVVRLLKKDKTPTPLCIIELKKCEEASDIFNLTRLNHSVVSVEYRRKEKNIPQCTKCQRYGHTKNYCNLTPRCVKCASDHHYSKCTKTSNEKPICVNCGEEHTANYKGCTYFQKINEKKNRNNYRSNLNRQPSERRPVYEARQVTPLMSFANIIKGSNTTDNNQNPQYNIPLPNTQNNPSPSSLTNTIIETLINLIKPHIETIKSFLMSLLSSLFQNGP